MGSRDALKPSDFISMLKRLGFIEARQKGSHKQFRHSDGRGATVPCHPGRDIVPILSRQIARDIGPTIEEFLQNQ
jgi:predicted RNA binding protein YcfA (HicA-like mRNA interferase family)